MLTNNLASHPAHSHGISSRLLTEALGSREPLESDPHAHPSDGFASSTSTSTGAAPAGLASAVESPSPPSAAGPSATLPISARKQAYDEVIALTQKMVRIDSTSKNRVAGENAVVDVAEAYAREAGLETKRIPTVDGRQLLLVTLPGKKPELGSVGFVQHSDVVDIEGQWNLGGPFSAEITKDERGREVMVGRGTIDTKGPAAQVLVAMKQLKQSGRLPDRSMQMFLFPDEETGGTQGAHYLAQTQPDLFDDVRYWVVEGSGFLSKENLKSVGNIKTDVPYVAMAQKYSTPVQVVLKNAADPQQAIERTMEALEKLDKHIEHRDWTFLGDKSETKESFRRFGGVVGGLKGWLLKNFWWSGLVQKKMGPELAATNRTDFAQTDFYLSDNDKGRTSSSNSKPTSTTAVLHIDLDPGEREKAIAVIRKAVGKDFEVEALDDHGNVSVSLPQEHYTGTFHGSIADRDRDAINRMNRALDKARGKLWWKGWSDETTVVDYYTNKSDHDPAKDEGRTSVKANVTLDLRVAVGEDVNQVLSELQGVLGDDFELRQLGGPETGDAFVRRLSSKSELFHVAEDAIHQTYGENTPVLFGNTTASNDVRYLMKVAPQSETLTFVPVLNTEHGAHGPDESVTIESLTHGVDWTARFMELIGKTRG
jgi:acetylornithine deacetylase/succinyl-diaminopimelate desuccinylase-like protein